MLSTDVICYVYCALCSVTEKWERLKSSDDMLCAQRRKREKGINNK
jgi:hypothetical protein